MRRRQDAQQLRLIIPVYVAGYRIEQARMVPDSLAGEFAEVEMFGAAA